jgi:hypothetical protein
VAMFAALAWVTSFGEAFAAEPVAVITEIHATHGLVQVKRAGEAEWRPIQPLLGLRSGDELQATGDGQAVVVFRGGGRPKTVTAANSPLLIDAPQVEPIRERLRRVLRTAFDLLVATEKTRDTNPFGVRHGGLALVTMLSPRSTVVFPGSVVFEWDGPDVGSYRVRVSGPQGPLWEAANLPRKPLHSPEAATPLSPRVRYVWELETAGYPAQRAEFEVLSGEATTRIRNDLNLLAPGTLQDYPPSTVVVLRAALLVRERLHAQARQELLQGIAANPEDPTPHFLLGEVYDLIGLPELASGELLKARDLSHGRP